MAITTMLGAKIHRREDPRLITGHGRFIDDMTRPGMAHMTVVRSPYAHAKIKSIDPSAAKKAPGVQAVYTFADFKDHIAGGLPVSASFVAEKKQVPNQFPIAHDEVVYQGEPVAVVLADTRYQAADAASLVQVEYEPLPAVMDIEKAMEKGSPTVHSGAPDNIGWDLTYSPDSEEAWKDAEVRVKERILQQRLFPIAIETRGVFGAFQAVACLLSGGAYKWKHIAARTVGILTNKTSTDPYRGAGRPEATHLVERAMDLLAREIGMDPVDVRRKNFATEFPFTNNFGLVYDSGNYEKALDKALELANYQDLRREQEALRKQGRYLGIGLSTWIEICGLGPSAATAPAAGVALVESSQVRLHPTGGVTVYVGTHSHGQSHDTTFAQIVADTLGVPYDSIEMRHGDTAEGPAMGYGTYGSRSLAVGGMSIRMSCLKVIDKAKRLAAHILEAPEDDVTFDQGP